MIHITVYNDIPLWFYKRKITTDTTNYPYSNNRDVRTIKKARRIAKGILNRYPYATIILSRYNNGYDKQEEWRIK